MKQPRVVALLTAAGVAVATVAVGVSLSPAGAAPAKHRYLVVARSAADLDGVTREARNAGATVLPVGGSTVVAVQATADQAASLDASALTTTVVPDRRVSLVDQQAVGTSFPTKLNRTAFGGSARGSRVTFDPAYGLPGLMWNQDRIRSPRANARTLGSSSVVVAVADTGLDYTHSELAGRIAGQADFATGTPDEVCKTYYGGDDRDLADAYGGPADTDWNGHGTWIGGNIGAALDGVGINGIAPKVKLFDLKIADWCGSTWDSSILGAFDYAAAHHFDVVSISFGGYLDRTDPEQEAIYQAYVTSVNNARKAGTLIVAAAGNEHTRIGKGGQVLSHGTLTLPGTEVADYYGYWETPGGIPGVVMVSATGNVVAAPSATCATGTFEGGSATCKRATDAHQAKGIGKQDQLTYYSNYGPRIDIAAPGGARKFNLPNIDGGGTAGFPDTTVDGTTAFEEFSITSNWAFEIPCTTFDSGPFYPGECYSSIQGTSMATPHVSAVAGLVASAKPWLRHRPAAITAVLKATARDAHNTTQPLSATDTSPADRTGADCPTGYCHLGGRAISDREAYGAGIVDAAAAVR
ncbi:MAG: S8 family serine peptidase [Candidatus Nanopelagicales bacterium]